MTQLKYLSLVIFILFTVTSAASCNDKSNKEVNITAQALRSVSSKDSLPERVGYVNDFEHIFTKEEVQSLDSLIADFEKSTTIEIALVTFDTTMTTPENFDDFTLKIAQAWGVGKKEKNNGIVIGISRGYRQMRIQNGVGIETILSDLETGRIIDTAFVPSYRDGDYYKGTLKGLMALMATLKERHK